MDAPIPLLATAVAATAARATEAWAQRLPCGEGSRLIAHLEREGGEDPAVVALDAAGSMMKILANSETGTWSMPISASVGQFCLTNHGSAWELGAPHADPGDPS